MSAAVTSATGGYIQPSATVRPPAGLSLEQFIQTVLVGVSALPGTFVRPKWQVEPPKQPDVLDNWLAFAITEDRPDANGFVGMDKDGNTTYQRHADLIVSCSFYGPDALKFVEAVRDGFQIPQNRAALLTASMGFVEMTAAFRVPEMINERWFNRFESTVRLRKETQKSYQVLPILSASGTITAIAGNENWLVNWQT